MAAWIGALIFVLVICAELYYSSRRGLKLYSFGNSMSHLTNGLGQMIVNLLIMGSLLQVYQQVYQNWRLPFISDNAWWAWALAILLGDFCYYWGHRAGHRINLVLAVHSVHHQAKDYNLLSAFRLPWLNRLTLFLFFLPLAFLGFSAEMVLAGFALNSLVATFSHSGAIRRRLGWIEKIFVTPRTHYVHHGVNGKYLDKNFGGIFIFWDKMFGSYQELEDSVAVELPGAEAPHLSGFAANTDYFRRIFFVFKRRSSLTGKLSTFFETPETLEKDLAVFGFRQTSPVAPSIEMPVGPLALLATVSVVGVLASSIALGQAVEAAAPLWQQLLWALLAFAFLHGIDLLSHRKIKVFSKN